MLRSLRTLFLPLVALAACDGSSPTTPDGLQNALVFTRGDGSTIHFPASTRVWCGPWEEGYNETPALHVQVGSPGSNRWWELRVAAANVQPGVPILFPGSTLLDLGDVEMFVLDGSNEASSSGKGGGGSITFDTAPCTRDASFSVDGTLGSELHGEPDIRVKGTFRSSIQID